MTQLTNNSTNQEKPKYFGRARALKLSFGEEVGNAVSHGVVSALILLALPAIAVYGYIKGGLLYSVGFSIFGLSMFIMFAASTLYHSMSYDSPHKVIFRIIDHCAIYIAIAGSFTPILLTAVSSPLNYIVLILQWLMVVFGVLYKSISKRSLPKVSVSIYLIMGWSAIILFPQLIRNTSPLFIGLIVLGGLLYTVGTLFYRSKKPWYHFIWHLFIIAASLSHAIAILLFL